MKIAISAVLALAPLLVTAAATPAGAEVQYPWCAQYRAPIGATNCGFMTYRQCLETISGVGGICTRNPAYQGPRTRR